MASGRVVIINHEYADLSFEIDRLRREGLELAEAQCATKAETIAALRDAVGIICIYAQLTERVLAELTECKVIARPGIGYDMINVAAARAHGIEVTYVPDYGPDEVADHAVALLMALKRRVIEHGQNIRGGQWDYKLVGELHRLRDQTLGLVGFGRIGQRTAAKMREIMPKILAYDPYTPDDVFVRAGVQRATLEQVFKSSDVISFHSPSVPETYHLVRDETIRLMEKRPILINTSRGKLIDTSALMRALASGAVAGAGLDVLESEPSVPDGLLDLDNVILTPHAAWYAVENELEVRTRAVEDLIRVIKGEQPRNPVP